VQTSGPDAPCTVWPWSIYIACGATSSSTRNYCVRLGQCDTGTFRGLYCNGNDDSYSVIMDYAGGNFGGTASWTTGSSLPFDWVIDGFAQGVSQLGPVSGGTLTDGAALGFAPTGGSMGPNAFVNMSPSNSPATLPSYANLVYGNAASKAPAWHSQTFTSGTRAQCTQTSISVDNLAYITVTAGGTLTIAVGPAASSSYTTLLNAATVVAGSMYTVRVPAQNYLKITASGGATYSTELQVIA
jgi:hypothetical protein